jgi:multiple antibiotic resistance protein
MFSFDEILTVFFALFAIIDIVGSIPLIISVRKKIGNIQNGKVTIAAGILMLVFLFVGEPFLNLMGVDISSFAIAGSIVMFILGLEMILGVDIFRADPNPSTGSIVPVAFPIIVGSGTLTTIVSLKADYAATNISVAILLNLIVVYLVLSSTKFLEKKLGDAGLIVIRKFFGIILIAIAIKIFRSNIWI